jgi:hypothetical protein
MTCPNGKDCPHRPYPKPAEPAAGPAPLPSCVEPEDPGDAAEEGRAAKDTARPLTEEQEELLARVQTERCDGCTVEEATGLLDIIDQLRASPDPDAKVQDLVRAVRSIVRAAHCLTHNSQTFAIVLRVNAGKASMEIGFDDHINNVLAALEPFKEIK